MIVLSYSINYSRPRSSLIKYRLFYRSLIITILLRLAIKITPKLVITLPDDDVIDAFLVEHGPSSSSCFFMGPESIERLAVQLPLLIVCAVKGTPGNSSVTSSFSTEVTLKRLLFLVVLLQSQYIWSKSNSLLGNCMEPNVTGQVRFPLPVQGVRSFTRWYQYTFPVDSIVKKRGLIRISGSDSLEIGKKLC